MSRRELLMWVAVIFAGFLLGFLGGYNVAVRYQKEVIVERDTVVKTVTVYKDFPQPAKSAVSGFIAVPRYCFITDTVKAEILAIQRDTVTQYVYLPREQKYYEEEDGKLRLWVSGYDPRLDRYEVDWTTTTITETHRQRQRRWGIGLQAGYGATVSGGTVSFAPFFGVGVSYDLFSW